MKIVHNPAAEPFEIAHGVRVVETDAQAMAAFPRNLFRWTAVRRAEKIVSHASLPSYHLRIERFGLFNWRVVPYQNVARKD